MKSKKYNSGLKPYIIWLIEHKLDFILIPIWWLIIYPIYLVYYFYKSLFLSWRECSDEWDNFKLEKLNIIKQMNKGN